MGLRFRRSIRIFKWLKLNFSKSGVSTTVGTKGASYTVGNKRQRVNMGLPGTGLSYSKEYRKPTSTSTRKTGSKEFRITMNQDGDVAIKYANGHAVTDSNLINQIKKTRQYKEEVKRLNQLRLKDLS